MEIPSEPLTSAIKNGKLGIYSVSHLVYPAELPAHWKRVQAKYHSVVLELQLLRRLREMQRRYALEHCAVRNFQFSADQILAEALMGPVSEGDMLF